MLSTLQHGGHVVATLSFDDGAVYIGRAQAILKRKLRASDKALLQNKLVCVHTLTYSSGPHRY